MSLSLLSPTGLLRLLKTWSFTWKLVKELKKLVTHGHLVPWVRTANRRIVVLSWHGQGTFLQSFQIDSWTHLSACSVGTGGRFSYCEGLGSLIWPFNFVKRRSFTCVELPFQSPTSCHGSYRDTVTLLYAWVEQNLCYGFHKCSTSELTLSTSNPAQTLTLATVHILCIPLPRRVEFAPKPVTWVL
jgi:hypothetical protein